MGRTMGACAMLLICITSLAVVVRAPCYAGDWVNMSTAYAPGRWYCSWSKCSSGGDCDQQVDIPADSPYAFSSVRCYIIDMTLGSGGPALTYGGNGVWHDEEGTVTFTSADGYEPLNPNWVYICGQPQSWTLPYPYVDLGDMPPGSSKGFQFRPEFAGVSSSEFWFETDVFGYATSLVPEPSCITVLLGLCAVTFCHRRCSARSFGI